MDYKVIGAVTAAIILAIALIGYPMFKAQATPSYTVVTSSSVTSNPTEKVYYFSATTAGNIPRVADDYINSVLVFGYAWLDVHSDPINAVVVTIHPTFRDSAQNPNHWHPHIAELAPTSNCQRYGLGLEVVNASDLYKQGPASPNGGISINKNTITLRINAESATVSPSTFDPDATAFKLVVGNNNALCVASP